MSQRAKPRILLIPQEFPHWLQARHWSYSNQLAFEEGLRAHGIPFTTIPSPWLPQARKICGRRRFDQVWIEIVHSALDESILSWVAEVAPIRLGFIAESMEYTEEECRITEAFPLRKKLVESRLKYLTHALAIDEHDVKGINEAGLARAMWWPQAVPRRFIAELPLPPPQPCGAFSGAVYGARAAWLERPDLKKLLVHQTSPEIGLMEPKIFSFLLRSVRKLNVLGLPGARLLYPGTLRYLRYFRPRSLARYIRSMQFASAVVSLPSLGKCHVGRIYEGMAAGRPVITWEIPDRPLTNALFENDKEILLYEKSDPQRLVHHLNRVISDRGFADMIAKNARAKMLRQHTIEKRTEHILHWIESGEAETYELS